MVVNRPAEKDDIFLEKARVNVVGTFAVRCLFNYCGNYNGHGFTSYDARFMAKMVRVYKQKYDLTNNFRTYAFGSYSFFSKACPRRPACRSFSAGRRLGAGGEVAGGRRISNSE